MGGISKKHLYWIVPVGLVAVVVLGFLVRNLVQGRDWKNVEMMADAAAGADVGMEAESEGFEGSQADEVKRSKRKVVYFFAEWCGHCRNLAPIWDEFVDKAKGESDGVDFFKVNVDKEKALAEANGVQALPDIRFITETSEERYSGERTVEGLMAALKKMPAAASKSKDE